MACEGPQSHAEPWGWERLGQHWGGGTRRPGQELRRGSQAGGLAERGAVLGKGTSDTGQRLAVHGWGHVMQTPRVSSSLPGLFPAAPLSLCLLDLLVEEVGGGEAAWGVATGLSAVQGPCDLVS